MKYIALLAQFICVTGSLACSMDKNFGGSHQAYLNWLSTQSMDKQQATIGRVVSAAETTNFFDSKPKEKTLDGEQGVGISDRPSRASRRYEDFDSSPITTRRATPKAAAPAKTFGTRTIAESRPRVFQETAAPIEEISIRAIRKSTATPQ